VGSQEQVKDGADLKTLAEDHSEQIPHQQRVITFCFCILKIFKTKLILLKLIYIFI
jgi:hypothetical protein